MISAAYDVCSDSVFDSMTVDFPQYKMDHPKRGICLVISNMNFDKKLNLRTRTGTKIDAESLDKSFSGLGFEVWLMEDASKDEMKTYIYDVSKNDHTSYDAFVLVILTHGKDEQKIYATDCLISIDELIEPLKGHKCTSLADKPKIIIIQACRGKNFDAGVIINGENYEADADLSEDEIQTLCIPSEANFIYVHSCVSGYVSFLNNFHGSWFIQAFTENLDKYKYSLEFTRILTLINMDVAKKESKPNLICPQNAKKKQASAFTSLLLKDLYFTPKTM